MPDFSRCLRHIYAVQYPCTYCITHIQLGTPETHTQHFRCVRLDTTAASSVRFTVGMVSVGGRPRNCRVQNCSTSWQADKAKFRRFRTNIAHLAEKTKLKQSNLAVRQSSHALTTCLNRPGEDVRTYFLGSRQPVVQSVIRTDLATATGIALPSAFTSHQTQLSLFLG